MALQDKPVCFSCLNPVTDEEPVFAAPCDHESCASAVFHGTCLMAHREQRSARKTEARRR